MINSDNWEDKALFVQIAAGDEVAFAKFFYSYLPRLEPFIRDLVKTPELTEELIQDTFLRVWMHRDKLPDIDNPRGWIYKIASRLCFNHLSRLARARHIMSELARTATEADSEYLPELGIRELRSIIRDAVDQLPERRRLIYSMSRTEGLSVSEIADRLDISVNTVKSTLGSALSFIRDRLEHSGYLLPALILSWLL